MTRTQRIPLPQEPPGRTPRVENARAWLLARMPVTEHRLELAGVSTAVVQGGEGPPIVLLHGPGEHAAKWIEVVPELVATHRVIAPDLPGHGASEVTDGPLDADRLLAWLAELIERTCASPPVLVGQLVGGAIAARFAAEQGARIDRLVLVDALGLAPFRPTPEFGAALDEFLVRPSAETHERLWRRCAFDLDRLRERLGESWQRLAAYNLDRARATSLRAEQHRLMEQFGLPAISPTVLTRIAVPTTLIWGRHDLATRLQVAEAASARFGWPLHVIEGAADDPPLEQPLAFLGALRRALGDPATRAGRETRNPKPATAPDERPEDVRAAWDAIAGGYDEVVTPSHLRLADEGLRRAELARGARFLDVAAGSGALSIPAARRGARVLATDTSPAMLERLARRARSEGLAVDTRVMDGQALELEDDSFDLAGSQFGVMLFPDLPRGVRELARVTRPGGRVLLHAYGNPDEIEFLRFFVGAVRSVRSDFAGLPVDPPPLPLQLQDPARLRHELGAAGLRDVRVETITEELEFRSGEQLWGWLVHSNPIVQRVLDGLALTDGERSGIRAALDGMVRRRLGVAGAAVLTNPVHVGIGTKGGVEPDRQRPAGR